MRPTVTLTGKKALEAIYRGVNAVFVPVSRTFGPFGRNALLFRAWNHGSRITNDGVTVSECQMPRNIHQRLVADVFKEASKKTNEKVGDGTTLTTVLGGVLFNSVYKQLTEQDSSIKVGKSMQVGVITLKKKILETADKVKKLILDSAKKVETIEDLENIATISVEDRELGKTIANMAWEVGVDGFIDVIEGYKGEIETEVIRGMRFPAKVPGKGFVNNSAKFEMIAKDCPVLITNYEIDNPAQIAKVINPFLEKNPKLIIMAPSFSPAVLTDLFNACFKITNQGKAKTGIDIFPVSVPSLRTEQFEDVAIYCGAKFIDKNKGSKLENITLDALGFLDKLVVKDTEVREDAIAIGGAGSKVLGEEKTKVQEHIEILKSQLVETKQEKFKKLLERRIASMASAVGVIRVGDSTDASALYRKLKVEDAVYACKAALRKGYVPGAGVCLKEIAETLEDDDILKETLIAPYKMIQSSVDGGIAISPDIIDPAECMYYALEHSTQIVANLITVDSITAEIEENLPEEGNFEMAKWMKELVINDKIHKGILAENKADAFRDEMGGANSVEEYEFFNRDK